MELNKELIVFVTHNMGKVASANKYFKGTVNFEVINQEIEEIRGSLEEVAIDKVKKAFDYSNGKPTIAVDSGFFIEEYNGFPGPYTNFAVEKIGADGILQLMKDKRNRKCSFVQVLAYYDKTLDKPILFHGTHAGEISIEKKD